jgi:tRNA(Ile)-lysidine synthase
MREALRQRLEEKQLIPAGSHVLVAYSGGPDSTCLLHLLHALGVSVAAAHLHHGQRPEAEQEAERCREFCERLSIPFALGRADVPGLSRDSGMGLEEAGRHARYGFFRQAARQLECTLIATAHTQDDSVETVLFNLIRGSGLAGLAGIPAQREEIIRPLLPFTRRQTLAYCQEEGLEIHHDPANTDLSFSRARIRSMVMPQLEAIQPSFRTSMMRFAAIVDEEDRFLNGMAAAALEKAETPLNGLLRFLTLDCEASFQRRELACLPMVLLKRAVRVGAEALGGSLDHDQTLCAAHGIAGRGPGSASSTGGAVTITWGDDRVDFSVSSPDEPFRFGLTIPGETVSDEFGWVLSGRRARDTDPVRPRASLEAVLDSRRTQGSLYFRSAQPGDALQPLGMTGTRKVADILSEMGLTKAARRRLPIICDFVGPIWIPGGPLADRVKVTAETHDQLILRLAPLES